MYVKMKVKLTAACSCGPWRITEGMEGWGSGKRDFRDGGSLMSMTSNHLDAEPSFYPFSARCRRFSLAFMLLCPAGRAQGAISVMTKNLFL